MPTVSMCSRDLVHQRTGKVISSVCVSMPLIFLIPGYIPTIYISCFLENKISDCLEGFATLWHYCQHFIKTIFSWIPSEEFYVPKKKKKRTLNEFFICCCILTNSNELERGSKFSEGNIICWLSIYIYNKLKITGLQKKWVTECLVSMLPHRHHFKVQEDNSQSSMKSDSSCCHRAKHWW